MIAKKSWVIAKKEKTINIYQQLKKKWHAANELIGEKNQPEYYLMLNTVCIEKCEQEKYFVLVVFGNVYLLKLT